MIPLTAVICISVAWVAALRLQTQALRRVRAEALRARSRDRDRYRGVVEKIELERIQAICVE